MEDIVLRALIFAQEKHQSQIYSQADGNHSYVYHLQGVVEIGERLGLSTEELAVCALHDIFEDTPTDFREVGKQFGYIITEKAISLAHWRDESYMDYIKRIGEDEFLKHVKLCDLLFNLEHTISADKKHAALHKRYEKALFYLATH
jgi:(p)ppGpp synthase/HD superfamily hydrolase